MSRGDQPCFEVALVGTLARAGLKGGTGVVRLDEDTLGIAGEHGGELAIRAEQVAQLRLVRFAGGTYGTTYEAKLWRKGAAEPLLLIPSRPPAGYGPAMKAFAGLVAGAGGVVTRGPGVATALINLAIMAGSVTLLAAGAVLLAIFQGGWGWRLAAAVAVLLDLLLLRDTFRNRWPRRVHDLDELDRELPPKEERPS